MINRDVLALLDKLLAEGACRGNDGFLDIEIVAQIDICATCPVIDICREYGDAIRATEVVYGGFYYPSKHWRQHN